MIKLSESSSLTLPSSSGSVDIINLDLLYERLKHAFKKSGYPNPGFSSDIVSTVKDYIEHLHHEGDAFTYADVENTIIRILCNSGFYSVASWFSKPAAKLIADGDEKLITPTKPIIQDLLHQDHFFFNKPIDEISDILLNKLHLLGFEKITETLLIALARNIYLISYSRHKEVGKLGNHSQTWTISSPAIQSLLNEEENRLFQNGVISIQPLSLLIPIVKIFIQLAKVKENVNETDLFELKFFPAFDKLCETLEKIINKLMDYINMNHRLECEEHLIEVLFNLKKSDSKKCGLFFNRVKAQLPELKKMASYHFPAKYRIRFSIG